MKYILCVILVLTPPAFARFNRTSGLIDIPTARILPHLGYRIGTDLSFKLENGPWDEVFEENMIKASLGLGDIIEVYFDVYTIPWPGSFTVATGFCHNFYNGKKLDLAWGIHSISYAADISEIAHGENTGWHDDTLYHGGDYEKPFEAGSGFLVSTYSLDDNINVTLGLGRGRYVGYGDISRYFNSNFYHDKGGDWGIGLFAGVELKANKRLSFIIEGDGRDVNVGCVYRRLPWEFGLALTKCEFFADWDEFRPRVALSVAYVKAKKRPGPGIIAGTVFDTQSNPLIAEVGISYVDIPKMITEPELGSYKFTKMKPRVYEVYASAPGYTSEKKKVEVLPEKTIFCDFVLKKIMGDIVGKVIDGITEEPLQAEVTIVETNSATESDADGTFEFLELEPGDYTVQATAPDYDTASQAATVVSEETTEVLLRLVKPVMVISLTGIKFDFDKATLRPESYPILDEVAEILKRNPDMIVEVQGHCCAMGSDAYNLQLSDRRANSVFTYLTTEHMIAPSRLIPRGYGERTPIATNATREGRKQNRRGDFVIIK